MSNTTEFERTYSSAPSTPLTPPNYSRRQANSISHKLANFLHSIPKGRPAAVEPPIVDQAPQTHQQSNAQINTDGTELRTTLRFAARISRQSQIPLTNAEPGSGIRSVQLQRQAGKFSDDKSGGSSSPNIVLATLMEPTTSERNDLMAPQPPAVTQMAPGSPLCDSQQKPIGCRQVKNFVNTIQLPAAQPSALRLTPKVEERSGNRQEEAVAQKSEELEEGWRRMPTKVKVKSLADKLTLEQFDIISDQIIELVNQSDKEVDGETLKMVTELIFEKAIDEPKFAAMCAKLVKKMLDNIRSESSSKLNWFHQYLLDYCQERFDRGWKGMVGSPIDSKAKAKWRNLNLINLLGELFKQKVLKECIIYDYIKKLMSNIADPEAETLESLCVLMTTAGKDLDQIGDGWTETYFGYMRYQLGSSILSPKRKLMIRDILDMRTMGWVPKTTQVREDTLKSGDTFLAKNRQLLALTIQSNVTDSTAAKTHQRLPSAVQSLSNRLPKLSTPSLPIQSDLIQSDIISAAKDPQTSPAIQSNRSFFSASSLSPPSNAPSVTPKNHQPMPYCPPKLLTPDVIPPDIFSAAKDPQTSPPAIQSNMAGSFFSASSLSPPSNAPSVTPENHQRLPSPIPSYVPKRSTPPPPIQPDLIKFDIFSAAKNPQSSPPAIQSNMSGSFFPVSSLSPPSNPPSVTPVSFSIPDRPNNRSARQLQTISNLRQWRTISPPSNPPSVTPVSSIPDRPSNRFDYSRQLQEPFSPPSLSSDLEYPNPNLPLPYRWLWRADLNGKKLWTSYNHKQAIDIEDAWLKWKEDSSLPPFRIVGAKAETVYEILFNSNMQRNCKTNYMRPIKRTPVDIAAAMPVPLKQAPIVSVEKMPLTAVKPLTNYKTELMHMAVLMDEATVKEIASRHGVFAQLEPLNQAIRLMGPEESVIIVRAEIYKQAFEWAFEKTPANWKAFDQSQNCMLVPLDKDRNEWVTVTSRMMETLQNSKIEKIEMVQNRHLWATFQHNCRQLSKKNSGSVKTKYLFHGSKHTPANSIYQDEEGFDPRHSAKGMWGIGCYFAVNASYSNGYAYKNPSGTKQVFLAEVITGDEVWLTQDNTLRMPPVKPTQNGRFENEKYDSVRGSTDGSEIYIIYSMGRFYPTYLITYRD